MYHGDTKYTFQTGDIVYAGIKRFVGADEYILRKIIEVAEDTDIVEIVILASDTADIPYNKAVFEIAVKYNNNSDYRTVYQEEIELKGVVNEEQ